MIHAYLYGHAIHSENGKDWYYDDTNALAYSDDTNEQAHMGTTRPCPQCNKPRTPEGYDACLGYLPGVRSACCGHGQYTGYIVWEHEPIEGETTTRLFSWGNWRLELKHVEKID